MIPVFPDSSVALRGKKGLIVGIANDQSIAWGCGRPFRALGADLAVTYLNERARKHVEPLAQALEAPIFMPLDVMVEGQTEAVFERIENEWGSSISCCTRSLSLPRKPCMDAWWTSAAMVSSRPWRSPAGRSCAWPIGRTVDEEWWRDVHNDVLRQPDGGRELQRDGSGEGRTGGVRPLHRCRTRAERDSRARDLARSACHAR